VWQHLMADDVWRIDYQMEPNADAAYISREDVVRERLERQFGKKVKVDIVWVGPYAYKSQCLNTLRMGRVFFMGDTAKIVNWVKSKLNNNANTPICGAKDHRHIKPITDDNNRATDW